MDIFQYECSMIIIFKCLKVLHFIERTNRILQLTIYKKYEIKIVNCESHS
jgi:hypothetical protein